MTSRWRRSPGVTILALVATMMLLVFGLALVGCGGGDETTTTTATADTAVTTETTPETTATTEAAVKITKMAVTAPEEGTDFGWNQQGVESAQKVAAEIGAEITVADGAGYEDITPILRELVEVDGSELTIAFASGYGTAAVQQAQDLGVPHVIVGQFEAGLIPGLAQDIETRAQNGSYLAGIVAAKMSKTGTLGIVISADDENWIKMAAGFVLGAQSVNPDAKLLLAQIGQAGYADAPGGKRVTESVIAGGADVVFGLGDGSSFGMIQAVETATPPSGADKVWFIDVIGDKTSLDKQGVLLTSVVWDYAPAFKLAVDALGNGTFGNEIIWLDIDNGGIDLLKSDKIPADVWAEVEKARAGIMDGSIKVPEIASKADVEAMIK